MSDSKSKLVTINYDWWEAKLKVTYRDNTIGWMKDQLLFWVGGQDMIDEESGDIEKAYFRMLGRTIIELSTELNVVGVREKIATMEGWAALDERFGVELLSVDSWEFVGSEFFFDGVVL